MAVSGELQAMSNRDEFTRSLDKAARDQDDRPRPDDEKEPDDDDDEAPETPLDEPAPMPVQEPPAEPDKGPYVVHSCYRQMASTED